jgi:serine/threonine protein kinase
MAEVYPDIRAIFCQALELESAEEVSRFLNDACRDDVKLRQEVLALLGSHREAGNFLGGASSEGDTIEHSPIAERPGTIIGPYKLLQQIGEGGFGVVFLAEQERPVNRRVALKIVKPGMDTRQVIARFEAERQALAMMDHPNIAKVHDAGATETGRPYFVMDLVKGVPITKYCDEHHLTPRQRLELFIPVCQAVQHAHQKGIIHRDLKPSNVMVALYDGRPVPKIIDFGVAKATGPKLTDRTMFTEIGAVIGTFEYMSPEQAELNQLDVDTRSDVYSLGVLLYELLTGTTPLERGRLKNSALQEVLRLIREEEPPIPSTRISTAVDLPSLAANLGTEPARLSGVVRGELDWIVMKCLEKERNRRYESASSLARDVERYLADEPVQACPPSVAYRLKKYIRRNKVGALAGSAVVIALVVGLALAMTGFVQARREARISAAEAAKATAISDLLQTALQSANPDQAKGSDYTVRQLLDDFSGGLANQLLGQPEVEAQLRDTIGNAYRRLGLYDLAAPQYQAALALRRRIGGTDTAEYAEILLDYAQNLGEQQRTADAERTAREAIHIYRRAGVSGRPLVKALWILQLKLAYRAEFAEEEAVVKEALAIAEANGAEYPELANMMHLHALQMSIQGDHAGAEEWARRAVDMHRRLHGNEHPETAYGLADLGRVLRDRKKYREAESAFREALAIFRRYHGDGDDHRIVSFIREELNRVPRTQGDTAGAEGHEHGAQERFNNAEQGTGSAAANRSVRLAENALDRELREALKSFDNEIADSPDNRSQRLTQAATYRQVAEIDLKNGKIDEALDYLTTAVAISSRLVGEEPTNASYAEERGRAQLCLAETLANAKRVDESLAAIDAVLAMHEQTAATFAEEHWFKALVVDTCIRMSSALPIGPQHTPENVARGQDLLRRAMEQLDANVKFAGDIGRALDLADMYIRVGQSLAADSDWSAKVREVESRLMALLQSLLSRFPNVFSARVEVGHKLRLWAFALPWVGEFQTSAEQALQQAIGVLEKLTVDFADQASAWHFLADTHYNLGRLYDLNAKNDKAEAAYRRAVALLDEHPESPLNNYHERANSYLGLADFLVRTERRTEAEEYYRKGIDVFEDASRVRPDVPEVYARIAYYLATTHREEEAAAFVRKAALNAQRLTDPNASADGHYYVAVAQLRLGDQAAYRATCKALIELPVDKLERLTKSRPIWTPCIAPNALDDPTLPVKLAEECVANNQLSEEPHYGTYMLGAAHYRAGQYEQAAERLEESIVVYPTNPAAGHDTMNYQQLLLAMTQWQLGEQDEARKLLAQTLPGVERELQSPSSAWNHRATLELLRAEAVALIEQKEADEAVENKSRSSEKPQQ